MINLFRRQSSLQSYLDQHDHEAESRLKEEHRRTTARKRFKSAALRIKNSIHFLKSSTHVSGDESSDDEGLNSCAVVKGVSEDIDEEDAPPSGSTRRLYYLLLFLDSVIITINGVFMNLPSTCLHTSLRIFQSLKLKGLVNTTNSWQGILSLFREKGYLGFFIGFPAIVGVQVLETTLSLVPKLVLLDKKMFLTPMQESALRFGLAACLAPVKIVSELSVARQWTQSSKSDVCTESLIETCSTIQSWALIPRMLYSVWFAATRFNPGFEEAASCEDDWVATITNLTCRFMPISSRASDRRPLVETWDILKSRLLRCSISLALGTLSTYRFGNYTSATDIGISIVDTLMRIIPGVFFNESMNGTIREELRLASDVTILSLASIAISNFIFNPLYFKIRQCLKDYLFVDSSARLLRKLRSVELYHSNQIRGHFNLQLLSLANQSTLMPIQDDMSQQKFVLKRQNTIEVKTAAISDLPRKRRGLMARLHNHYGSTADPDHCDYRQIFSAKLAELLNDHPEMIAGTNADAIVFDNPEICEANNAILVVVREDPLPSLQGLALLPRHGLIAQIWPVNPDGSISTSITTAQWLLKVCFVNEEALDVGGVFRSFMDFAARYLTETSTVESVVTDSSVQLSSQHILSKTSLLESSESWSPAVGDIVEVHIESLFDRYYKGVVKKDLGKIFLVQMLNWNSKTYKVTVANLRRCLDKPLPTFEPATDGGLLPVHFKVPDSEIEVEARAASEADSIEQQHSTSLPNISDSSGVINIKSLWTHFASLFTTENRVHVSKIQNDKERDELSRWLDNRLALFAVGRLMALAIIRNTPFEVPLSRCIFKVLIGEPFTPNDVGRIDPDFLKHRITPLLGERGVAVMEEMVCDHLYFVGVNGEELVKSGHTKRVTERNKKKYVRLLVEHYLVGHCRRELSYLAKGFYDVIPRSCLSSTSDSTNSNLDKQLTALDLELLVCGMPGINVDDWKVYTCGSLSITYLNQTKEQVKTLRKSGTDTGIDTTGPISQELTKLAEFVELCTESSEWFWEVIDEFSVTDRAKVLMFTTGSGRLPAEGFRALRPRFQIDLDVNVASHNLPTSHTCFNQLVLPLYGSKVDLKTKLSLAINHAHDGFGFI